MNEEHLLRQQLAYLHQEYRRKAEPIIQRLAEIEACKPPRLSVFAQELIAESARRAEEWAK